MQRFKLFVYIQIFGLLLMRDVNERFNKPSVEFHGYVSKITFRKNGVLA